MLHLIVFHHALLGYDFFQQQSKPWNVPLAIAQLVEQPALGVLGADLENRIERAARGDHAQILVEHQNGLVHRVDNRLGECTSIGDVGKLAAEPVEFHRASRRRTTGVRTIDPSAQGRIIAPRSLPRTRRFLGANRESEVKSTDHQPDQGRSIR